LISRVQQRHESLLPEDWYAEKEFNEMNKEHKFTEVIQEASRGGTYVVDFYTSKGVCSLDRRCKTRTNPAETAGTNH
jgi:hypothetical protein